MNFKIKIVFSKKMYIFMKQLSCIICTIVAPKNSHKTEFISERPFRNFMNLKNLKKYISIKFPNYFPSIARFFNNSILQFSCAIIIRKFFALFLIFYLNRHRHVLVVSCRPTVAQQVVVER